MNGVTGMDYVALPIVAKGLRIKLTPSRMAGIGVMEGEALRVMANKRGK
jgi:hypothetical protein